MVLINTILSPPTILHCRGNSLRRVKNGSTKWKVKEISLDGGGNATNNVPGLSKDGDGNKSNRNSANLSGAEISPALLAQANWTFVEKLLKVSRNTVPTSKSHI